MENNAYKRLRAFIDPTLPEVEKTNEPNGQTKTTFPQYENFLDSTIREVQNQRLPSFKNKIEHGFVTEKLPDKTNEATSFEKILSSSGVSKDFLDKLHYRTRDSRSLDRNAVDDYMYDMLVKSQHPEALVNEMRVAKDSQPISSDEEDAIKKEKVQLAAGIVGMPTPNNNSVETVPNKYLTDAQGRMYTGFFDPAENKVIIGEDNFNNFNSTLAHELMHKKDWDANKNRTGSPENAGNDFLSKDFSSAVKDRRINNWHHDETLQVPETSEVSGDEVPRGIRAAFFNRLKGLLKD